jgi:hypothetical protein
MERRVKGRRGTMKVIMGWICDPCVHLIGIGLVVGHLVVGMGSEGESETLADSRTSCSTCKAIHGVGTPCPLRAVQRDVLPASN